MGDFVQLLSVLLLVLSVTFVTSHNLTESEILAFDAPAEIKSTFPYYLSGYYEDGAPIWVFELGKWDLRKYTEKGGPLYDAMDIYVDQMYYTFKKSGLSSSGKQFFAICDLDEFKIRQAGHPKTVQFILSKFVTLEQIVSGGSMRQGWVVNANALWGALWKLGSPLLAWIRAKRENKNQFNLK
ncbi:unnamed protein product [Allacma fusca]|uniref:CRAL-TRIO domain-containing protein n=1 Tax=Allacma fusca TaxID=39272 RepID=A0A8J2KNY9_9HEXA|nr:unnamed protein product [Allacma fusca]